MPKLTRESILDAIRAGVTTSPAIAKRLGSKTYIISNTLFRMRDIGRVIAGDPIKADGETYGRPPVQWRVNEDWVSGRYSARARAKQAEKRAKRGPESEQRRIEAIRAHYAARGPIKLAIPRWVPKPFRRTYHEIARVLDEEIAAEWARKAKAMLDGGANAGIAQARRGNGVSDPVRAG